MANFDDVILNYYRNQEERPQERNVPGGGHQNQNVLGAGHQLKSPQTPYSKLQLYFICGHCMQTIEYGAIADHRLNDCPLSHSFTCVECEKEFSGSGYKVHNKCRKLKEYTPSTQVGHESLKKTPQEVFEQSLYRKLSADEVQKWQSVVHGEMDRSIGPYTRYFEKLKRFPNLPRSRLKFQKMANTLRIPPEDLSEVHQVILRAWARFEKLDMKIGAPPPGTSGGGREGVFSGQEQQGMPRTDQWSVQRERNQYRRNPVSMDMQGEHQRNRTAAAAAGSYDNRSRSAGSYPQGDSINERSRPGASSQGNRRSATLSKPPSLLDMGMMDAPRQRQEMGARAASRDHSQERQRAQSMQPPIDRQRMTEDYSYKGSTQDSPKETEAEDENDDDLSEIARLRQELARINKQTEQQKEIAKLKKELLLAKQQMQSASTDTEILEENLSKVGHPGAGLDMTKMSQQDMMLQQEAMWRQQSMPGMRKEPAISEIEMARQREMMAQREMMSRQQQMHLMGASSSDFGMAQQQDMMNRQQSAMQHEFMRQREQPFFGLSEAEFHQAQTVSRAQLVNMREQLMILMELSSIRNANDSNFLRQEILQINNELLLLEDYAANVGSNPREVSERLAQLLVRLKRFEEAYQRETAADMDIDSESDTEDLPSNVVTAKSLLEEPGRSTRPDKILIIMRGPSGSGKSRACQLIKEKELEFGTEEPLVLSIDDFFVVENEKYVKNPDTGGLTLQKIFEYDYDPDMEDQYMIDLFNQFCKKINEHRFVMVDGVFDRLPVLQEFENEAKHCGFEVYIAELLVDAETCAKRNIHKRSQREIEAMTQNWEVLPETTKQLYLDSRFSDAPNHTRPQRQKMDKINRSRLSHAQSDMSNRLPSIDTLDRDFPLPQEPGHLRFQFNSHAREDMSHFANAPLQQHDIPNPLCYGLNRNEAIAFQQKPYFGKESEEELKKLMHIVFHRLKSEFKSDKRWHLLFKEILYGSKRSLNDQMKNQIRLLALGALKNGEDSPVQSEMWNQVQFLLANSLNNGDPVCPPEMNATLLSPTVTDLDLSTPDSSIGIKKQLREVRLKLKKQRAKKEWVTFFQSIIYGLYKTTSVEARNKVMLLALDALKMGADSPAQDLLKQARRLMETERQETSVRLSPTVTDLDLSTRDSSIGIKQQLKEVLYKLKKQRAKKEWVTFFQSIIYGSLKTTSVETRNKVMLLALDTLKMGADSPAQDLLKQARRLIHTERQETSVHLSPTVIDLDLSTPDSSIGIKKQLKDVLFKLKNQRAKREWVTFLKEITNGSFKTSVEVINEVILLALDSLKMGAHSPAQARLQRAKRLINTEGQETSVHLISRRKVSESSDGNLNVTQCANLDQDVAESEDELKLLMYHVFQKLKVSNNKKWCKIVRDILYGQKKSLSMHVKNKIRLLALESLGEQNPNAKGILLEKARSLLSGNPSNTQEKKCLGTAESDAHGNTLEQAKSNDHDELFENVQIFIIEQLDQLPNGQLRGKWKSLGHQMWIGSEKNLRREVKYKILLLMLKAYRNGIDNSLDLWKEACHLVEKESGKKKNKKTVDLPSSQNTMDSSIFTEEELAPIIREKNTEFSIIYKTDMTIRLMQVADLLRESKLPEKWLDLVEKTLHDTLCLDFPGKDSLRLLAMEAISNGALNTMKNDDLWAKTVNSVSRNRMTKPTRENQCKSTCFLSDELAPIFIDEDIDKLIHLKEAKEYVAESLNKALHFLVKKKFENKWIQLVSFTLDFETNAIVQDQIRILAMKAIDNGPENGDNEKLWEEVLRVPNLVAPDSVTEKTDTLEGCEDFKSDEYIPVADSRFEEMFQDAHQKYRRLKSLYRTIKQELGCMEGFKEIDKEFHILGLYDYIFNEFRVEMDQGRILVMEALMKGFQNQAEKSALIKELKKLYEPNLSKVDPGRASEETALDQEREPTCFVEEDLRPVFEESDLEKLNKVQYLPRNLKLRIKRILVLHKRARQTKPWVRLLRHVLRETLTLTVEENDKIRILALKALVCQSNESDHLFEKATEIAKVDLNDHTTNDLVFYSENFDVEVLEDKEFEPMYKDDDMAILDKINRFSKLSHKLISKLHQKAGMEELSEIVQFCLHHPKSEDMPLKDDVRVFVSKALATDTIIADDRKRFLHKVLGLPFFGAHYDTVKRSEIFRFTEITPSDLHITFTGEREEAMFTLKIIHKIREGSPHSEWIDLLDGLKFKPHVKCEVLTKAVQYLLDGSEEVGTKLLIQAKVLISQKNRRTTRGAKRKSGSAQGETVFSQAGNEGASQIKRAKKD